MLGKMVGKAIGKLFRRPTAEEELVRALVSLSIAAAMTLGACLLLGLKLGLLIGVVPFLMLDGFGAVGTIVMYFVRKKMGESGDERGTNPFLPDGEDDHIM